MSDLPPGGGGFFPGFLGDLLRLLRTDAPFPFELAEQLAESIAGADGAAPVDPIDRIRLEELTRLAAMQVGDVSGMRVQAAGRDVVVEALGRVEWARANLRSWRSSLEALAKELRPPDTAGLAAAAGGEEGEGSLGALLGQWASAIGPAMIAMQFGSLVGHLATRTLGQYELVLPRDDASPITVVPQNVAAFSEDWSLSKDDVTFYLLVRDVALHAVVTRPHVRERLSTLILEHARGFRPDPGAIEQAIGEVSLGDPPELDELTRLLGSPAALGQVPDTPEQRRVRDELATLSAAIGGYAEWVTRTVAERTIGGGAPITEALRRRRVERGEEERAADALFGLSLDQAALDRGERFVRGVLERGGESELAALFVVESYLPTPGEIDAPELWLERTALERGLTED